MQRSFGVIKCEQDLKPKKNYTGPCPERICDSSGYIWTHHKRTQEFVAFRCVCNTWSVNLPQYSSKHYPEYERHK